MIVKGQPVIIRGIIQHGILHPFSCTRVLKDGTEADWLYAAYY